MAGRNPFARIRLVFSRSSTTVKCVVLAALALSTLALMVLRYALLETKAQLEDKRAEAAALEQDNRALQQALSQLGTVQSVEDLAGKLLGLVDPDTVIFLPELEETN